MNINPNLSNEKNPLKKQAPDKSNLNCAKDEANGVPENKRQKKNIKSKKNQKSRSRSNSSSDSDQDAKSFKPLREELVQDEDPALQSPNSLELEYGENNQ